MPYLVVSSPAIRRAWLSLAEQFVQMIAAALIDRDRFDKAAAVVAGWSIVSIFMIIVDAVGATAQQGQVVDGDASRRRRAPRYDF
jgi:hypothetical protein